MNCATYIDGAQGKLQTLIFSCVYGYPYQIGHAGVDRSFQIIFHFGNATITFGDMRENITGGFLLLAL